MINFQHKTKMISSKENKTSTNNGEVGDLQNIDEMYFHRYNYCQDSLQNFTRRLQKEEILMRCKICDRPYKNTHRYKIWEDQFCRICSSLCDYFSFNGNYLKDYWS